MAEVKRIALFLDGTWNNVQDNTNVWRLKCLCLQSSEQVVYYSAGVGTQSGEPALVEPKCRTLERMKMANAFCRYLEMAERV